MNSRWSNKGVIWALNYVQRRLDEILESHQQSIAADKSRSMSMPLPIIEVGGTVLDLIMYLLVCVSDFTTGLLELRKEQLVTEGTNLLQLEHSWDYNHYSISTQNTITKIILYDLLNIKS